MSEEGVTALLDGKTESIACLLTQGQDTLIELP